MADKASEPSRAKPGILPLPSDSTALISGSVSRSVKSTSDGALGDPFLSTP